MIASPTFSTPPRQRFATFHDMLQISKNNSITQIWRSPVP